ncbi:MAG TPA: hypothetical protein VJS92_12300 [Candidatus Polarisedimenticolaceae bacterium]|nr:hypothetical protein [Candidatus Polarisedimenticolaceae bacterium]
MKKQTYRAALPLIVVALAAAPVSRGADPPADKSFLGCRWSGVARMHYRIHTVEQTDVIATSGNSNQTKDVTIELTLEPSGQEQTLTWLTLRLERAQVKLAPPGIEVDTAAAANPNAGVLAALPAVYAAIHDKPLRLLVTPGGRVRKVEGVQELLTAARAKLGAGPEQEPLLALVVPTSDAAAAAQFANVVFYLPGISESVGFNKQEQWPAPTGAGQVSRKLEFTGVQPEGERRSIVVRQEISGDNLPPVPDPSQQAEVTTAEYRASATLALDATLGVPARLDAQLLTRQTVRRSGDTPDNPSMSIKVSASTETRLANVEAKAAAAAGQ